MIIKKYIVFKVAIIITSSLIISCSDPNEIKLPLAPQKLNSGWERITIDGIGFIDIPPSMEVQSGNYKEFAEDIKGNSKTGISDITIQTKGANNWEADGLKKYARILLKTELGNLGDFNILNYTISKNDLKEIPEIDLFMKEQICESFFNTPLRLLE